MRYFANSEDGHWILYIFIVVLPRNQSGVGFYSAQYTLVFYRRGWMMMWKKTGICSRKRQKFATGVRPTGWNCLIVIRIERNLTGEFMGNNRKFSTEKIYIYL